MHDLSNAICNGNWAEALSILSSSSLSPKEFLHKYGVGSTILHLAANCGHFLVVSAILDHPECPKEVFLIGDAYVNTALHLAAQRGDALVVQAILEHEHCPDEVFLAGNGSRYTALHEAARRGHASVVQAILNHSQCPKEVLLLGDRDGNTPLHLAAIAGKSLIVQAILEHKHCSEDVFWVANDDRCTALHEAAGRDRVLVVHVILLHERCPDDLWNAQGGMLGKFRGTPFDVAKRRNNSEVIMAFDRVCEQADMAEGVVLDCMSPTGLPAFQQLQEHVQGVKRRGDGQACYGDGQIGVGGGAPVKADYLREAALAVVSEREGGGDGPGRVVSPTAKRANIGRYGKIV